MAAHESSFPRDIDTRSLVVFCDFDGTFSVQDVGATIAKLHLGERRVELWARYESGDLTAWQYNELLFEGFVFGDERLDAFLQSVELDPHARDLLAWCEAREVPFRILSDGFDTNLDRLQRIHNLRFEYSANALRIEDGRWQLRAGAPNAACNCGTGSCKRGHIGRWRDAHPGAFCVHVGNGRVSDLCGALAADLVFAKESLAEALDERGVAYLEFATLGDVIAGLERCCAADS